MWVPAGGPHAQLVLRTGKRMLRDVSLSTVEQTTAQDDGCGNGRAPRSLGKACTTWLPRSICTDRCSGLHTYSLRAHGVVMESLRAGAQPRTGKAGTEPREWVVT